MITAIVFSRDRACQLDLLLRSIAERGSGLFAPITVIYKATTAEHELSYRNVASDHPQVDLQTDDRGMVSRVRDALQPSLGLACFFTDDSVFYRQPQPVALNDQAACHSFRLGNNTTWCYPHAQPQQLPVTSNEGGVIHWRWHGADGDFGYPGSLDGHVFRHAHLKRMLVTAPEHANPNQFEDHLNRWCKSRLAKGFPLMSAEETSSLVGVPVNRVNDTHPNRHGERFAISPDELLERYLAGQRLVLPELDDVRGAHQEVPLVLA